jgi:capsular exopolysaccharide synthesis family protein
MEVWRIVSSIGQAILRRRKALAGLTFGVAILVLAPIAFLMSREPARYRTTATILIEARPANVPLFQEYSPFRPLPVQLAILNSRSLAQGVLESLPRASLQDLIENPYYVDYEQFLTNAYRRLTGGELLVDSPQQRALKELQNSRITFTGTNTANGIVVIAGEASKPQVAIDLVSTYIEVLLSRTRSFNVDDARVTREFLEQQVAELKRSVDRSEEALRAFTASHGGIRLPEQSQTATTRLGQVEGALAEITGNRQMTETRLAALREKLQSQKGAGPAGPAPAAAPEAPRVVAPGIQRLREHLSRAERTLLELRTKYTDEHPRVLLVKDEIADLQRQLGTLVKETTPSTPAPGAVPVAERQGFSDQVVLLETSLHALSAQEDALRKEAAALRQNLGGLSRAELEFARLTQDVEGNRRLYALISERLAGARIREQGEMKVVKVIDPAGLVVPVPSRKRMMFGGAALMLATVCGLGVPALLEWVRRPIENEQDVREATGLPVLAIVPRLESQRPVLLTARERKEIGRSSKLGDNFMFNEAFRDLRVGIQLAGRVEPLKSIMISSALPSEGKSTVLINLGLELGEIGRRVVLADTDFLRPTLHRTLRVQQNGGLADVLHARTDIGQALVGVGDTDHVLVATRGTTMQRETRGLLATERLTDVLKEMSDRADYVLCDSSPVLLVPDNLFLASAVDGVIIVVNAGQTSHRDLARAKTVLESAGAKMVGVVINQVPVSQMKHYYRRYYARYYHTEGRDKA